MAATPKHHQASNRAYSQPKIQVSICEINLTSKLDLHRLMGVFRLH
jgi:hypothetical protein